MSIKEHENRYQEAVRYLDNASGMLHAKAVFKNERKANRKGMGTTTTLVEQIKPTVHY